MSLWGGVFSNMDIPTWVSLYGDIQVMPISSHKKDTKTNRDIV